MGVRAERKRAARERIVTAAATRLREEGLSGAAVGDVMADAGLTHGAFYAHFPDKVALVAAAIEHALTEGRARWVADLEALTTAEAAARLAERYLNERHRDDPGDGCTFAALGAEVPRAPRAVRARYETELRRSLAAVTAGLARDGRRTTDGPPVDDPAVPAGARDAIDHDVPPPSDDALAFLALCVGGLQIARAIDDEELSQRILRVCRAAATELVTPDAQEQER
jgi:TetR/AcrR family transcriptional repressor of nem operon